MDRVFFVTPLHGITINDELGSGIRLGEHGWIGNNPTMFSEYVGEDWWRILGSATTKKILNAKVFVFGELSDVPPEQRWEIFTKQVEKVKGFLDFLWVVKDNAVNSEICVFSTWDEASHKWINPVGLSPTDSVTMADGRGHTTLMEFSKTEIETVAGYMSGLQNINVIKHFQSNAFKTQNSLDRPELGRFYVHIARRASIINAKIALYCSGFEAILTTSQTEVSHQIAERTALLITGDPEHRMEVYRDMKQIYEVRSKAMHGKFPKLKGETTIEEVARQCDEYMRMVIWRLWTSRIEEMYSTNDSDLENYFQRQIFETGKVLLLIPDQNSDSNTE
jgi:hypothetical protein